MSDDLKYDTEILMVDWDDPASIEKARAHFKDKQPLMLAWINEIADYYAQGCAYIPEPVYSYAQCCFLAGASHALNELQEALGPDTLLSNPKTHPLIAEIAVFRIKQVARIIKSSFNDKPIGEKS